MFSHFLKRNFSSGHGKVFLLSYEYTSDIVFKRIPHHIKHLRHVQKFIDSGCNVIGGSKFPNDGARLIFECQDKETVESFVEADPFYKADLVTSYDITELEVIGKRSVIELTTLLKYKCL